MSLWRFVESRADDFAFYSALHVGDFFRTLINEQHDERYFRVVDGNRIGHGLQHHGLSRAWRSDDQTALAFAYRAKQIQHTAGHIFLGSFHLQPPLRIERREVIEEDFVPRHFRIFEIYGFHFDQFEVTLAVLGWTDLAGDGVSRAEIKLANLRRRNVNIVRARKIVVFRGAQ